MPEDGQSHPLRRGFRRTDTRWGAGKGSLMPETNQEATEPKTFTQEEVNAIVEKRVARVKSEPPADYEELKRKAAAYDEAQEAAKTELQKATEAATGWKAKYDELNAQVERRKAIDSAAAEYKVDASMLARMEGDVEDNAKFLAERAEAEPKYGDMHDSGNYQGGQEAGDGDWLRKAFEKK